MAHGSRQCPELPVLCDCLGWAFLSRPRRAGAQGTRSPLGDLFRVEEWGGSHAEKGYLLLKDAMCPSHLCYPSFIISFPPWPPQRPGQLLMLAAVSGCPCAGCRAKVGSLCCCVPLPCAISSFSLTMNFAVFCLSLFLTSCFLPFTEVV